MIPVRATQQGYYGHKRVREGTVFNLVDRKYTGGPNKGKVIKAASQFSDNWMVKVKKGAKSQAPFNPADGRIENRNSALGFEDAPDENGFATSEVAGSDDVVDANQEVI